MSKRRRLAGWLLVVCMTFALVFQGGAEVGYATWDPVGCTDVVVALSLTRSIPSAHFGDTVSFRARIDNSSAGNCSLGDMTLTITTPDGVVHQMATGLDVPQGVVTPWYSVDYVISPSHIANNRATARATATGVVHDNTADDSPASSTAATTVLITPIVSLLSVCTQGATATSPPVLRVSGTTTDAPAGANIAVTVGAAAGNTTTDVTGAWSVILPWNQPGSTYNIPVTVTYGQGNGSTSTKPVGIRTIAIAGGETVATPQLRPVITGTSDAPAGSLVDLWIDTATATASVQADGSWSLPWPEDLTLGAHEAYARIDLADGVCASDAQLLTVVNAPPVAVDDAFTTIEDTPLIGAVLPNDFDVNGDALSASLVSGPSHGTVMLNGDGSFVYTPGAGYHGMDSFTYKANDGQADSNVATVMITVVPVNDRPVAVDDAFTTNEDTPVAGAVLPNDSDDDGDVLTATMVSSPSHGTVVLNPDGSFTYTPAANFSGVDSFTYKANDGQADSNVATVTITINAAGAATRTRGFWQTHYPYAQHVLNDHLGGQIDLGWVTLRNVNDVMGIFYASPNRNSDGSKRTDLGQARILASAQAVAAILNTGLTNGKPLPNGLTHARIAQILSSSDIAAIQALQVQLDAYNNSGDAEPIRDGDGTQHGPAESQTAKANANIAVGNTR